jgi:alpha-L-rhamnosidase
MSVLTASTLRCEYRTNPLGLDEPRPRLSWTVSSDRRAQRQSAYRILVASAPGLLSQGRGDLWDSGMVSSSQTAHIAYGGAPLVSRQRCWWTVQSVDGDGKPSAWAAPAWWEMALLSPGDWRARWIGAAEAREDERLPLGAARWIRQTPEAPADGFLQVRHRFALPEGAIASAWLRFIADGRSDPWSHQFPYLWVNGQTTEAWRWMHRLRAPASWDVAKQLKAGDNELAMQAWRNDGAALLALLRVEYADGRVVEIPSSAQWEARFCPAPPPTAKIEDVDPAWQPRSDHGAWRSGKDGWALAREIGRFGSGPWPSEHIYNRMDKLVPAVHLRTAFQVGKPLARARIYASACGMYELRLNGARVGDHELAPGWTDYRKRVQYQCNDVTALIRPGDNALGALIGDGWFSGSIFHGANIYGYDKALLCQLHLDYADGSTTVIVSDESWRAGCGSVRSADLFHGEDVDARRELAGWDGAAPIVPGDWRQAKPLAPAVGVLVAQPDEPVRVVGTLPARTIVEHRPGVFIVDFAQNLPGRVRLRLRAPAGTRVRIRHGEMLAKDGSLYTENLRSARATDTYVCRGGGETYEPRLTFHGFRYAEITGLPGALDADDVVAVVIGSDCPWSGAFSCSEPRLMQLQSNIRWGQRGNFISIPTDCPQRDERAGWTGDAQIFVRTGVFNMDSAPFYTKFQLDVVDTQHANGAFADFAPVMDPFEKGRFGWGDAGVILPWTIWKVYGDTRLLERNFRAMKGWVDHRSATAKDLLNTEWSYGDWVSPPPQTPHEILGPIYHSWAARIVAEMAAAIGRRDEAATYAKLADDVAAAWRTAHLLPDGRLSSDTQCAYVLALRYQMLLPEHREAASRHLVAAVERAGWHLHTGFLGTGHLLPALSEVGRDDVAFRLLLSDTFPSWLYTVKHGATTMWERWDSYHAELGPQNIGNMNSYNHYAFGAVGEWMYSVIGGIDLAEPGFGRIVIRPRHGGLLTHARTEYRSIRGPIISAWRIVDGRFLLEVHIPANATAEVHVPTRDAGKVEESGGPVARAEGVRLLRAERDAAVFDVGSGSYAFSAPL